MKLATFIPCFFILVLVASTLTRAQETDDEREFSYDEHSKIGPKHWGEIHPNWSDCNSGRMQSPIDMTNQRVKIVSNLGLLDTTYVPSNATLLNRGHDIMLRWGSGAGHIQIDGTLYQLQQCHWHSPSEHTINGRRFDMEIHLVHRSDDGRTAVIGIMYKTGRHESFLSMLKHDLKVVAGTRDVERDVGIVDPALIKFGSRKYYRYMGSLTTPPCTENVIWTIVRKVRTVSREQVKFLRDAVHDDSGANARPVQPVNGRRVELYRPKDHGD